MKNKLSPDWSKLTLQQKICAISQRTFNAILHIFSKLCVSLKRDTSTTEKDLCEKEKCGKFEKIKRVNILEIMTNYQKTFLSISLIIIFVGISMMYFSNDYTPKLETIKIVDKESGKIEYKPNYNIEFSGYLLNIAGQSLISVGVGILLIVFISEILTKQDRKNFEKKIEEFQKKTAEDAMLSVFDTLIDKSFYDIIRRDIIGIKLIRKNVNWSYIIQEDGGKKTLKRIITYDLHNLTSTKQSDIIKTQIGNNKHTTITKNVVKINNICLKMEETSVNKGFTIFEGETYIEPNGVISVNIEIEQHFNSDYIYETHVTNHPLTDLTLTVIKPKNSTFELTHKLSSTLELTTNSDELLVYKANGGIYVGQCLEFYSETI